jgi:hypothetical protein
MVQAGIDAGRQIGSKRQMEFYQWLLRQNGMDVSDLEDIVKLAL